MGWCSIAEKSIMESNEILTLRAMAWQRAKGELNAMIATYQAPTGSVGAGGPEQEESTRDEMASRVRDFIGEIDRSF